MYLMHPAKPTLISASQPLICPSIDIVTSNPSLKPEGIPSLLYIYIYIDIDIYKYIYPYLYIYLYIKYMCIMLSTISVCEDI